jgi:membrane protease YdiL (CAAX protease family)
MNHPVIKLLILLLIVVVCAIAGTAIFMGLALANGHSLFEIQNNGNDMSYMTPNLNRIVLAVNQLFTFTIPALIFAMYFYRKKVFSYFKLDKSPNPLLVLLGIVAIFAALPLVQASFQLNQLIPLPEWAINTEDQLEKTMQNILNMKNFGELIFSVILIGILPAIGEELIFRGIVQTELEKMFGGIAAIIVSAIIFSAIHGQFEGFLPRFALGALLGCLYYWTRSLWVPVIAHLVNNGSQVIMLYFSDDFNIEDINSAPDTNMLWVLLSSAGMIAIYFAIRQIRPKSMDLEEQDSITRAENEMNV